MECPICFEGWNYDDHIPRTLGCGHSFCQSCLKERLKREDQLICPTCMAVQEFSIVPVRNEGQDQFRERAMESLPKNFTLLSILQEQSIKKRCPSHSLILHSYTVRPYSLVCDKCIEDFADLPLEIKPIPEVLNETQKNLDESLSSFQKSLLMLKDLSFEESPLEETCQELENHFSGLLASLDKSWVKAKQKLKEVPSEKLKVLEQAYSDLSREKRELDNLKNTIDSLQRLPDEEMAQNYDKIESISLLKIQQSRDNISPFSLTVKVDESILDKLGALIENSFSFDNNPNAWVCENCRQLNIDGEITCLKCERFRPISSYPNILKNPNKVTEKEINELKKRREMEIKIFNNPGQEFSSNSYYYIVDGAWQKDLKNFLYNVYESYLSLASPNPRIGMLPPGPVTNHLLYANVETQEFLDKLKPVANYRAVNLKTWQLYMKYYGGGPEIIRRKINIYDQP